MLSLGSNCKQAAWETGIACKVVPSMPGFQVALLTHFATCRLGGLFPFNLEHTPRTHTHPMSSVARQVSNFPP